MMAIKFEVSTESRDNLNIGFHGLVQQLCDEMWIPEHWTPPEAADFVKDYIQRALDDEMALILIEADWWK
jgi:hypothetical protein